MNVYIKILVITLAAHLTVACGGGSSSETTLPPPPQSTTGLFTLGVTDAPVDSASEVNIQFSGVEIKPANGNAILYTFDPRTIDLLSLQGGASELLLENIELEAGQYNWIRLQVNAERNTEDSYLVDENGNRTSLWVPSGASSGLKLNNSFVVSSGGVSDFTIDFDLRKSITNPVGQSDYILKPRLRIVDNTEVGEISGTVDVDLIIDPNPDSEGDLADNCSESAAVYVFTSNVALAQVDDIDLPEESDMPDVGGPDPITTATVEMAQDGVYEYTAAFLSPGDYVITLTCQADLDESDVDNTVTETNTPDNIVEFTGAVLVTVTADSVTTHNFSVSTQ